MKRKLIVWLMLLALLFTGCTTQTPNAADEANTVCITIPQVSNIYEEAVLAIGENVTVQTSVVSMMNVGNSKFITEMDVSTTYIGYGTEDLAARRKVTTKYGGRSNEVSELYQAGVTYATFVSSKFSQEMTQEDFVSRYTPTALLDAHLYETITMDENKITFTDALALESWLDGELISATGTAIITDGVLTRCSYNATYKSGGSEQTITVIQSISPAANTTIPDIDPEEYVAVESLDAVALLDQSYYRLIQATDVSYRSFERVLSHAAAYTYSIQTNIDTWRSDKNPMIQVEQDISDMDYMTNRSYSSNILEVFRDGKYTYTEDDGEEIAEAISLAGMVSYCQEILTEQFFDSKTIQSATLTAVNGAYLAEFTMSEEWGNVLCTDTCNTIWGDPDLLNNAASKYENVELSYYVAVDQYTGLPTALGYYYEGCHTLDGQDYPLTRQVDCYIDAASLDAYEAITEEPSPDKENEGATPLLYHVTGENGQEMWLFGTIHVGDDRTGSLPQELYDAFAACDALAIECDTEAFDKQLDEDEELSAQVSACYFYSDGSLAKDHIQDEELYDDAILMLKASGNFHGNVPYLKAYILGSSLDSFYLRLGYHLTSDKGAESRLTKMAKEQNKPIWEVESNLFQIQMLTGYSDPLQEELLKENVYTNPESYLESVEELYALWCAGDEAALIEQMKDDTSDLTEEELALNEEYNKAMMTDRNDGMLEVAKQYLESGDVVFYAVGLAHLLDETNGLVFTLRDAGYTVTLIEYQ